MDLREEYGKILAFRVFRHRVIAYFFRILRTVLSYSTVSDKQLTRFLEGAFVRWWFISARHGYIVAGVPTRFLVVHTDLTYFLRKHSVLADISFPEHRVTEVLQMFQKTIRNGPLCAARLVPLFDDKFFRALLCSSSDIIESFPISAVQVNGLYRRFRGAGNPEPAIVICLARLLALGSLNEHMSLPPPLLPLLGIDVELFGTPLNTSLPVFCSPDPDVDAVFGSEGSFFDYTLPSNARYLFNPPYDEELMTEAVSHLCRLLRERTGVTVLVLLPVWDAETQEKFAMPSRHAPYPPYEELLASGYVRDQRALPRVQCPFYNYFTDTYAAVTAVHLLLLSTELALPVGWEAGRISREWLSAATAES